MVYGGGNKAGRFLEVFVLAMGGRKKSLGSRRVVLGGAGGVLRESYGS